MFRRSVLTFTLVGLLGTGVAAQEVITREYRLYIMKDKSSDLANYLCPSGSSCEPHLRRYNNTEAQCRARADLSDPAKNSGPDYKLRLESLARCMADNGLYLFVQKGSPEYKTLMGNAATVFEDSHQQVPPRLISKWSNVQKSANAQLEAVVRGIPNGYGGPFFTDVEIKGSTIYLWVPHNNVQAIMNQSNWSTFADLADIMIVRCGCLEGKSIVGFDTMGGYRETMLQFSYDSSVGRSVMGQAYR